MKPEKMLIFFSLVLLIFSCEKEQIKDDSDARRIKQITIQNNSITTGFIEFIYESDRLVQILRYSIDIDTTNSIYSNWNIQYEGEKIIKNYYSTFYSGHENEVSYQNEKTEFLIQNNRVIQILNMSQFPNSSDWHTHLIETFEYSSDNLDRINHYRGSVSESAFEGYEEIIPISDSLTEYNTYSISCYNDTTCRKGVLKYKNKLLNEVIFIYPIDHPVHDTISIEYKYDSDDHLVSAITTDNIGGSTSSYEYNYEGLISRQIVDIEGRDQTIYSYKYEDGNGNADEIWHNPIEEIFIQPYSINILIN